MTISHIEFSFLILVWPSESQGYNSFRVSVRSDLPLVLDFLLSLAYVDKITHTVVFVAEIDVHNLIYTLTMHVCLES